MKTNEEILVEVIPNFVHCDIEYMMKVGTVNFDSVVKLMDAVRTDAVNSFAEDGFKTIDKQDRRHSFFLLAIAYLDYIDMIKLAEAFIGRIRSIEVERLLIKELKETNEKPNQVSS